MQDRRYYKGGNPVHAQACQIIALGSSLVIQETQCRTGGTVKVEILSHAQACQIIAVGGSLVIEETQCRTGGTVRVEILSMHKHVR